MEDTGLSVQSTGSVVIRQPPLGGQSTGIHGIQETVISRIRKESLQCEGQDRENTGEEGDNDQNDRDQVFSNLS